ATAVGVLPEGAADDIVAVAQGHHAVAADLIAAGRADQAVGGGNGPDGGAVAGAPGDRSQLEAAELPEGAADDVVAVGQGRHSETDLIAARGADEAIAGRDGRDRAPTAVDPGGGAHGDAGVLPAGAADDIVAVAQG